MCYMYTAKNQYSYMPDEQVQESEIYAVMLFDGYYITEDNSLSLLLREAKQFCRRRDAISLLPYWQGQGHECFVIDITEKIKMQQKIEYEN
jgi:hypothetical protein